MNAAIELKGALDISVAAALKQQLLSAISEATPRITDREFSIRLSLTSVTELDVTAVQVIAAASREAARRGLAFSIEEPLPEAVGLMLTCGGFREFTVSVH